MIVYHFAVNDLRIQLKYLRIYILGGLVAPQTPDSGNQKNPGMPTRLWGKLR